MNAVVGDTSPDKHGWRWRMHHAIITLTGAVALIVGALFTGLPLVGQVAWAAEVDKKIAAAVEPISKKVDTLENAVSEQNAISKAFLAKLAADSLVDTLLRMCTLPENSPEWRRLNQDYERFRADYAKAAGREYRELRCPD